jgi:hypothetical protein
MPVAMLRIAICAASIHGFFHIVWEPENQKRLWLIFTKNCKLLLAESKLNIIDAIFS